MSTPLQTTISSGSSSSSSPSPANKLDATSASDNDSKLQLFLGGSCNPTTWRQNVAIPFLETNGISYYNPQVDNWTPDRVDSERYAKQNAQILLFVIDKQTRSTVSIVESAYMAGENKSLVLVIYPFDYNILSLTDTSRKTSNIIETSSMLKETIVTSNSNLNDSSSFTSSSTASRTSSTHISSTSESTSTQSHAALASSKASSTRTMLSSEKYSSTSRKGVNLLNQESLEVKHKKTQESISTVSLSGELISLREFRELEQARSILDKLVRIKNIPIFTEIIQALNYVTHCLDTPKMRLLTSRDKSFSTQLNSIELVAPTERPLPVDSIIAHDIAMKDIYLSLDSEDHLSVESMVTSILEKEGLTYNCTSVNSLIEPNESTSTRSAAASRHSIESQSSTAIGNITSYTNALNLSDAIRSSLEKEICAIKSSRVLLFVITNKCRGLSIMVLASHFMALFRHNVVLCVQYLEEPCSIAGEFLTKTAIADYNRGRVYLCDYATKSQVPVFNSIQEAIECCSRKCR